MEKKLSSKNPTWVHSSNNQPEKLEHGLEVLYNAMTPKPRVTTLVNTHIANHIDRINIDGFAKSFLEDTFPEWMPKPLRIELKESLRGFNEWAALWVAESLMDCYGGHALATTGIKHIDDMLWTLYAKIFNCAREKGVMIANHR